LFAASTWRKEKGGGEEEASFPEGEVPSFHQKKESSERREVRQLVAVSPFPEKQGLEKKKGRGGKRGSSGKKGKGGGGSADIGMYGGRISFLLL